MQIKIGYYPGCSLEGSSREYSESVMTLAKSFDVELEQVPDWNCCGATAAHNLNHTLSFALPARILAKAAEAGMDTILVPCAACYNRLTSVQHELAKNDELRKEVNAIIEADLKCDIKILNIIQFIQLYVADKFGDKQLLEFNKKVACYYGCLLVRPHDVLNFDRTEDPQSMDEVMRSLGANPIDWPFKTECCGAGMSVSRTDIVGNLSGRIVKEAADLGAEAIIVACPMCHSNLDMRRPAIEKAINEKIDIPVIYISQAIDMVLGKNQKETGINRHFVPVNITLKDKVVEPVIVTEKTEEN
ncbi:MAG: CoB--CoM heterodisulfide reductase iron-sulfur subunit B family protein [Bacteroidota bacterium]